MGCSPLILLYSNNKNQWVHLQSHHIVVIDSYHLLLDLLVHGGLILVFHQAGILVALVME
jgi:hypothetical protein